jgi:hypothetical protein
MVINNICTCDNGVQWYERNDNLPSCVLLVIIIKVHFVMFFFVRYLWYIRTFRLCKLQLYAVVHSENLWQTRVLFQHIGNKAIGIIMNYHELSWRYGREMSFIQGTTWRHIITHYVTGHGLAQMISLMTNISLLSITWHH